MPNLFGVWTLRPFERAKSRGHLIGAAIEQLSGEGPAELPAALSRVDDGRLLLFADATKVRSRNAITSAYEGFVSGTWLSDTLLREEVPEGPYVALRHDARAGRLTLYRGPSGGERLYLTTHESAVYFSSTVRALMALPFVDVALDKSVLKETLLTGLVMFGDATLHQGVREVLPGHSLTLTETFSEQRWSNPHAIGHEAGEPRALARKYKDKLVGAIAKSAGPARPVCVALSGGIDSSAIAAAAVEAFGADQVHAITYEFQDPSHNTERDYATLVADRLGITKHHFFDLEEERFIRKIPESVWRGESLVHWPKAFMLLVAEEVRSLGYDRYFTGFGIGSHTGFFSELGSAIERGRLGSTVTKHWKHARFGHTGLFDRLAGVHPSLEPPHPRLYLSVVKVLESQGVIRDPLRYFPEKLRPHLEDLPRADSRQPSLAELPPGRALLEQAFTHLISCIDVTRSEKASRELGVYRLSPAHFDSCLPYAYFPVTPRPKLRSDGRTLRPGKYLTRLAFEDMLPDEVLYRVKDWGDAVASPNWIREGRRLMVSVLPDFPRDAARWGSGYEELVHLWEPNSILASSFATRLWERMFIELPPATEAPTWLSLWESLPAERRLAQ